VRGRAAHEANKVVVLLGGDDVGAEVANSLRVDLCGRVEAETNRNVLVLQITIDGLRAANNLALSFVLREVFGKEASIRVRIVTADDNKTVEVESLRVLERASELLRGLNLVTSGADHIKATSVAIEAHVLFCDLHIVV